MAKPHLTFFCELEANVLQALFAVPDMVELAGLQSTISLGILDLSQKRAEIVQRLNQSGIPVIAWLLLPKEQGYWFNVDNAPHAVERYLAFKEWTDKNGLVWAGIGLNIEPDIRDIVQLKDHRWELLGRVLRRIPNTGRLRQASAIYRALVYQIHSDGYPVETYQLPVIIDERKLHSSLLQRIAGLVDLKTDKEVLMLYTSIMRPMGTGYLWSYAPEAQAIGVGSTGGGVDLAILDSKPLNWDELARDLRLAWVYSNDIYIFSLEGCARQGILAKLKNFEWDVPIVEPTEMAEKANAFRQTLQTTLWFDKHSLEILAGLLSAFIFWKVLKRWIKRRSQ